MHELRSRIRGALAETGQTPIDDDIVEELAWHAAAVYEAARADGTDTAEADRRVDALIDAWKAEARTLRRRRGRVAAIPPPAATANRWAGLVHDVKYAMRLLRRRPAFSLVAMLTMALGIGASSTLFSIVNGVLLKPLPWPDADRLVRLSESRRGYEPRVRGTITNGTYIAWHSAPGAIEDLAGWRNVHTTALIGSDAEPIRLRTASVTPTLFNVLKVRPFRGRVFDNDDGRPGGSAAANDVVVISYGLWQERLGGRDDAVGTVMRIDGRPFTIIGVMPRDFAFPDSATRAWTPWAVPSVIGEQGERRVAIFSALARLRADATSAQAAAEGTARARSAPDPGLAAVAMFGGNGPAEIAAVPAVDMMTAEVKPGLLVLLAAAALLLVTATANVASLQLARATTRRREIAIRAAIGAGTARLTRQLIIESALIGLGGGAAGLLIAAGLHGTLPSLLPSDFPRIDEVTVDGRVMLFAMLVTIVATIICGVVPAFQTRRLNLVESLSDDGGAPVGFGIHSPTARARMLIIVGQLAVSCVLLVGAALLTRSFVALLQADRGYGPRNLLTARIPLPTGLSLAQRTAVLEGVASRVRVVPGVTHVAFGNALPLVTSGGFRAFKMRPPRDPTQEVDVNAIQRVVSPAYFAALGLRVVAGRPIAETDTMTAPQVIVVNRSFAERYLGADPLGASVPNLGMCRGDNDRWQVVGVVEDMRQNGVGEPPQPEIFLPIRQIGCAAAVLDPIFVVRTTADPGPYVAALRAAVRAEAPFAALDSVMTMEERLTTSLAKPRLYAVVLAGFGVFALVIAVVGLFGVLSYTVSQRAREIAVRVALGARPANIVLLVARQLCAMAIPGIAVGLGAAAAAVGVLSNVLYGVDRYDPATFVGVALLLLLIAATACIVPARWAASIDPLVALRAA